MAVNTERQPTLTIIGSMAGSILVSAIAIGTLIVLQHGAMRSDMRDQHAAMRSDMNNQFTSLRSDMSEQLTMAGSIRGDMSVLQRSPRYAGSARRHAQRHERSNSPRCAAT